MPIFFFALTICLLNYKLWSVRCIRIQSDIPVLGKKRKSLHRLLLRSFLEDPSLALSLQLKSRISPFQVPILAPHPSCKHLPLGIQEDMGFEQHRWREQLRSGERHIPIPKNNMRIPFFHHSSTWKEFIYLPWLYIEIPKLPDKSFKEQSEWTEWVDLKQRERENFHQQQQVQNKLKSCAVVNQSFFF